MQNHSIAAPESGEELHYSTLKEDTLAYFAMEIMVHNFIEDIINFYKVSKTLRKAKMEDLIEIQLKQHFPHIYQILDRSIPIDWKIQFKNAYQAEYKKLPNHIKKLLSAIKGNNVERLEHIAIHANDLHYTDVNGVSVWQWAQRANNQAILDSIYQKLINDYDFTENFFTQLIRIRPNSALKKTDIRKIDKTGSTLFHWAIRCNQSTETVKSLIDQGSDIRAFINDECTYRLKKSSLHLSAIHLACMQGNIDIVKLLVAKDSSLINQLDNFDQSPIFWAAYHGHTEIVEYLAIFTTQLNRTGYYIVGGLNPLHTATKFGYLATVKALIDNDADLHWSTRTHAGQQALHIACEYGYLDIVKLFVNKDPTLINGIDFSGQTPLFYAVKNGHDEIVRYLIDDKKVKIDTRPHDQLIHLACKNGQLTIVKFLLEKQTSLVNHRNDKHETPILLAAKNGHATIVTYLAEKGADVNLGCNTMNGPLCEDYTPLHIACEKADEETINILLKYGADLTQKNLNNKTPVQLFTKKNPFFYELKLQEFIKINQSNPKNEFRYSFSFFAYKNHLGQYSPPRYPRLCSNIIKR